MFGIQGLPNATILIRQAVIIAEISTFELNDNDYEEYTDIYLYLKYIFREKGLIFFYSKGNVYNNCKPQ